MIVKFDSREHIRTMYDNGMTTYELAELIGISQPAVSNMLTKDRDIYIRRTNRFSGIVYEVKLLFTETGNE